MQPIAKVLNAGMLAVQHHGRVVVGQLPLWLGVDAHQLQVLPHLLQQVVKVPAVVGGDGHAVGNLVYNVQLLDGYLIWKQIKHHNAVYMAPQRNLAASTPIGLLHSYIGRVTVGYNYAGSRSPRMKYKNSLRLRLL